MNKSEIQDHFCQMIQANPDLSVGVVAIRILMKIVKDTNTETFTVQGLCDDLKDAIAAMKSTNNPVTAINSAAELFMRFITLTSLDMDTRVLKQTLIDRGTRFLTELEKSRSRIATHACKFVVDGSRILTHSRSRVVLETLIKAAEEKKQFTVYVTMSAPENSGEIMYNNLREKGISCILILDSAVGYVMEQIDLVMVGAEGVVESGGIINKIGCYTMAVCARELKKPFYVLTESFKFSRLYPLNQADLPEECKYSLDSRKAGDLKHVHPLIDYTPPSYLTLLFTDLGIIKPSGVSDELIKLYL